MCYNKVMIKWEEKKTSLGNAIVLSFVMAVVGGVIGANWNTIYNNFAPYLGLQQNNEVSAIDWSPLNEVYNQLASSYNGEIDNATIIDGAKKGMTDALGDKYTVYMTADESENFYDDLHGDVGYGVGVEVGLRDGYVRVLRTLPDNPAQEVGILAGDIVYKINGEEVYNLSTDEIAEKIRGEEGSEVTMSVVRDGEEKEFKMKREKINNVSAYVEYDGDTAIVTLTRFDQDTGKKVQQMANEFKDKGVNKVILDLRNNGGGYVSAAQDLLSLWLDGQEYLQEKSLHYDENNMKTDSGKALLADTETVVLVNGSSASASEIVAGALQDYGKATVVGEATYGKGVVQSLFKLSGGTTLKVTTAEWLTPKDRSINDTGITPDVVVERTFEDINAMRDPQLDKAKEL